VYSLFGSHSPNEWPCSIEIRSIKEILVNLGTEPCCFACARSTSHVLPVVMAKLERETPPSVRLLSVTGSSFAIRGGQYQGHIAALNP